jgi:hypothetical protein
MKEAGDFAGLFFVGSLQAFAAHGIYRPFIKQTLWNQPNCGTSSISSRCRAGSAIT